MPKRRHPGAPSNEDASPEPLRIIGGKYRGSKLRYEPLAQSGGKGLVTRPMKHRVREAIFNLVGLRAEGKHAVDLFAGTGALGLEAISRGALKATFIERHLPTAEVIRENIAAIGLESSCELTTTSAFLWVKRDLPTMAIDLPLLVFLSPPYDFFVDRQAEMLAVVDSFLERMPASSILVVEADERFDFSLLPGGMRADRHSPGWDVRAYSPAVVGLLET